MEKVKLNQFPAVNANGVSTLVTDELLDKSIHAIIFERGGTTFTKAHMTNLRLRLNGKDIINGITGTQLQDINDYDGIVEVGDYLVYFFGDPTARTTRGQHLGDLDLSVYRDPLEIEVTIGAATAPTLQCWALAGVPKQAMGIGFDAVESAMFRTLVRSIVQPAAAITRKSYGISLGATAGARWRKTAMFHANLTSVEYKKASLVKHDDIDIALNSAIAQYFARVPQAGLYVLDNVVDGNQGEAETTVDANGRPWNQQISLTTSGGDTISVFADMHAVWPQI